MAGTPNNGKHHIQRIAPRTRRSWLLVFVALWGLTTILASNAWSYTPDSPEVRSMLDRALAFLEKKGDEKEGSMLGGQCLTGLAAYKYNRRFGKQPDLLPPMTQRALARALADVKKLGRKTSEGSDFTNYSIGIALIFLTEVHPQQHVDAIQAYLAELLRRQKPHGGWGYLHSDRGDLSQLQYAVLGLWSAKNVGLQVEDQRMIDVMEYVIRVQDPSGGWGYQGKDPGDYSRVPQLQIRASLCAAGLGSLYVGSDFLGMSKSAEKPRALLDRGLPPALIPVIDQPSDAAARPAKPIDIAHLKQAINDGWKWFAKNKSMRPTRYQYYFLYGFERLHSFKEKVDGKYEDEPAWYNEGVRILRETQRSDGSWGFNTGNSAQPIGCSPPIGTGFSMLFLLRSTRETIAAVVERDGILRGGYGLPQDLSELKVRNNRIVAPTITGEVDDLLTMLEDEEGDEIENMLENPDALSLKGMKGSGREFTDRLARILRSGESYQARIVAARALGRQGDLDNVPVLIFGLSDPDPRVIRAARDALRRISRKFDGFGLPDKPTPSQVAAVVKRWKAWYKTLRPDAVFFR